MCGVVGIIDPSSSGVAQPLAAMSRAVRHRGPDDAGSWVDQGRGVGLAHRRLSVIDLSPTGHQPMTSADGRWVLAFNGEIYDHDEQRAWLSERGKTWRGSSDTEVLLELVAEVGVAEALRRVDGMFACAFWDRRGRELVLARDRIGEKPLYYGRVGGRFAFASELSALDTLPGRSSALDPEGLASYLRRGFVTSPHAIVAGLRRVPPGATVRVDAAGRAGPPEQFWSLFETARTGQADTAAWSDEEAITALGDAMAGSVSRRLGADVAVGAFLSGGVDSTTVVALAQQVSPRPVRTFTVAVGGPGDESSHAARIAHHLGTDHLTLPLPDLAPIDLVQRVVDGYDEPFADPSAMPTSLLSAAARDHVTVALSGDGADELFAGYNRYRVVGRALTSLRRLPTPLRAGAAGAARSVSPDRWDRIARGLRVGTPDVGTKVHKLAHVLAAPNQAGAQLALSRMWDPEAVLVDPPSSPGRLVVPPPELSPLAAMLLVDQTELLPDDMLVKVDRASMASALEVRVPFLAPAVVDLSWRLPDHLKVRQGQGKWIVRELLGRHVPRHLWDRPKVGFDPPLADWLRGPLSDWAQDLLSTDRLRRQGLIRPEPVAEALTAHLSGRENRDYALWTMLMLQAWLDRRGRNGTV